MARRPMRFARQALALQIGLIVLVVGMGFVLAASLLDRNLVHQYGQRALGVARAIGSDADLAGAVALGSEPEVRDRASRAQASTGALFIVVTDNRGVRLAHPNPAELGKRVSTDPTQVLAGQEVVNVQRGTLGLSARGKVPLRERDGTIVGQVSVGFDAQDIDNAFLRLLGTYALFTGGALVLGVVGSALLTRMLKRRTLGLEPDELAELVRQREAVLFGIGEGVLAVDAANRVSVCNGEAARLLGTTVEPGEPVDDVDLPSRLRTVLDDRRPVDNLITVAGDRVLVANHRLVRRAGANLGGVLTLRDRTDLENLNRELESVRGMTDALRAQRHEFTNRLHALSGLLQTDHHAEAVEYLQALVTGSISGLGPAADAVRDPYVVAFLSAKKAAAQEKGVALELGETSWVETAVIAPVEATTVVGNLVDNACDAAWRGVRRPARVEVDLLADGTTLHVSVMDSGDGVGQEQVAAEAYEDIFVEGVSSHHGDGRGLGLALCRQAARSLGGDVSLVNPGGDDAGHGAVFVAVLPHALESVVNADLSSGEWESPR